MGRKAKYSPEGKKEIVRACIEGEDSIKGIARRYRYQS